MARFDQTGVTLTKHQNNAALGVNILPDAEMRAYGFTDHVPEEWYLCRKVSEDGTTTLNLTIAKDGSDWVIDVLDEYFLQPPIPAPDRGGHSDRLARGDVRLNPLNGLTLFYQEESPHSGQPLVLGKKDKVLLIQGRTGAGKTLLARRIAGQAYKRGIKVCVMSDKEPHCHEYSGRNLTEVTCDGKTVEEILETLPQTDSHAPMLFVFDAIDTPMCTGPFPRHEGIRTFSVFLEKVTNSPNLAVIAVTQSFTMLDDLATGESVNVAVTHDAFPKNACEYHAIVDTPNSHCIYAPKYSGRPYRSFDREKIVEIH